MGEGSSGDLSSSDEWEADGSDHNDIEMVHDQHNEYDEYVQYIINEEINDDLNEYHYGDNSYSVYDLLNDPKYQICIYQQVIIDIDYNYYQIDPFPQNIIY